jgi:hypothetical protein
MFFLGAYLRLLFCYKWSAATCQVLYSHQEINGLVLPNGGVKRLSVIVAMVHVLLDWCTQQKFSTHSNETTNIRYEYLYVGTDENDIFYGSYVKYVTSICWCLIVLGQIFVCFAGSFYMHSYVFLTIATALTTMLPNKISNPQRDINWFGHQKNDTILF